MQAQETEIISKALSTILSVIGSGYYLVNFRGGFTGASKFIAMPKANNHPPLFVKYGTVINTLSDPYKYLEWLNREIEVLKAMGNQSFLPRVVTSYKGGTHSVLAVEYLDWPNKQIKWTKANINEVLRISNEIKGIKTGVLPATITIEGGHTNPWIDLFNRIELVDPSPYASRKWLENISSKLIAFDPKELLNSKDFCHGDLGSDNIRIMQGSPTKFVDWTFASRGDHYLDIAYWLPSLKYEGGPDPWEMLPNRPDLAIMVAGYFFSRVILPEIPDAPLVRMVQRKELKVALNWLANELKLPNPV